MPISGYYIVFIYYIININCIVIKASFNQPICNNFDIRSPIDGITELKSGQKLIFKGRDIWLVDRRRNRCHRRQIGDIISSGGGDGGDTDDTNELLANNGISIGVDAVANDPRLHLTFIFKDKWLWFVDSDLKIREKSVIASVFYEQLDSVDAALYAVNQRYDGFIQYDRLYLFKDNQMWTYYIEMFMNEYYVKPVDTKPRLLDQLSQLLPRQLDSAYSNNSYVYLIAGGKQYRIDRQKFVDNHELTADDIQIEPALTDIIELNLWTIKTKQLLGNYDLYIIAVIVSTSLTIVYFLTKLLIILIKNKCFSSSIDNQNDLNVYIV
ncbi:uncharacterized protein LOC128954332 [Oppia nitens]|uniref:uncharacterized protein LOC128954332 n=1 Tax=Oppia nitens TaxID=1686743 RepID=UPI0023D9B4A5|nr:uncharacterized protein LOC128954332 [Oppia nitens]